MRRTAGFTLVELLVTASLMTLVGGACVAALTGGVNVWQRARQYQTHDEPALIAFEQMQRDLQNVRRFLPIPPEGRTDRYAFAAVSRGGVDGGHELGHLSYFLDRRLQAVCRSFVPFRRMNRSRPQEACRPVMDGVMRLRFSYFGKQDGELRWSPSWDSPDPPAAVKVSVQMGEGRGPTNSYSFVVSLMSVSLEDDDET